MEIQAKDEILLNSGGGYIRLKGGNIEIHCPSSVSVKGASHDFKGPGNSPASLTALPQGQIGEPPRFFEINHHWPDLEPVAGAPYRVEFADGTIKTGKLDAKGFARLEGVPAGAAQVFIGDDSRPPKLERVSLVEESEGNIAEDLRRLGLDPETTDLQALVMRASARML